MSTIIPQKAFSKVPASGQFVKPCQMLCDVKDYSYEYFFVCFFSHWFDPLHCGVVLKPY